MSVHTHTHACRACRATLQQTARNEAAPACVYLSMKCRAFGTLWSPRCTTAEPTHPPSRCWQRHRMLWMALLTRGAGCTRFSPWPVCSRDATPQPAAHLLAMWMPCIDCCTRRQAYTSVQQHARVAQRISPQQHAQPPTCVAEAVGVAAGQHVGVRTAPQHKHGVVDLPPCVCNRFVTVCTMTM